MTLQITAERNTTDSTIIKVYNDPAIVAGTRARFDFGSEFCWKHANAIANGAAIANLVDGAPPASLFVGSSPALTHVAGKGFLLTSALEGIIWDALTQYFTAADVARDLLFSLWVALPNTTQSPIGWLARKIDIESGFAGGMLMSGDTFVAGASGAAGTFRFGAKFHSNDGNTNLIQDAAQALTGGYLMLSVAVEGLAMKKFNGTKLLSTTQYTAPTMPDLTKGVGYIAGPTQVSVPGAVVACWDVEDLTTTGRTAAAAVTDKVARGCVATRS